MDNGKKEHATNDDECDYLYRRSRRIHGNNYGKAKKVKKQVNRRFRRKNKNDINDE